MKILLAGFGQYPQFAPAWVEAIKQLGHEAFFFDFQEYTSSGIMGRLENRMMHGVGPWRLNRELYVTTKNYKPDVILIHNGNFVNTDTIKKLREICWVAGYQHDDPFGAFKNKVCFRNFRETIPHYDSHHVIREINLMDYKNLGIKHVELLRTYYVPWLHYPLKGIKKDLDVVFVGHAEKDKRLDYISYLIEKKISIKLFGSGKYWKRHMSKNLIKTMVPIFPVLGDEYIRTLTRSKICLAFYSTLNRDECAYRVFEIPACGSFLLAERTNVMKELYEEGKEVELFSSPSELYEKIIYYINNPTEREKIAANGHYRAVNSGYDVNSRMKQWVSETTAFAQK